MQRKQQVGECWVCVIFFACVCVWVRQIRRLRLTIRYAGMPPPGYAERSAPGGSPGPTGFGAAPRTHSVFFFFLGGYLLFLADFAIFS
jgi:hypothetical protein